MRRGQLWGNEVDLEGYFWGFLKWVREILSKNEVFKMKFGFLIIWTPNIHKVTDQKKICTHLQRARERGREGEGAIWWRSLLSGFEVRNAGFRDYFKQLFTEHNLCFWENCWNSLWFFWKIRLWSWIHKTYFITNFVSFFLGIIFKFYAKLFSQ